MLRVLLIILSLMLTPVGLLAQPAGQPVDREAEIRAAVASYVQQKTAGLGCQATVRRLTLGSLPVLPAGALDYEVVAPQQWEGWGSAGISIIVRQGDRVLRNLNARLEVDALAEMVVTTRQIDHGSIISANDLALRKQDLAAVNGRFLASIDEAVGKKARITFKANAPLKSDQLEKLPLVKPGQLVTIIAENERMRITVSGKAKSAGAAGDTISVQNLNSQKEIPARVIDAGTVVVVF